VEQDMNLKEAVVEVLDWRAANNCESPDKRIWFSHGETDKQIREKYPVKDFTEELKKESTSVSYAIEEQSRVQGVARCLSTRNKSRMAIYRDAEVLRRYNNWKAPIIGLTHFLVHKQEAENRDYV
jgi:hypothetical protein